MSVMVAYRWPVSVFVATTLTPGSGTFPAFTVPCTSPPAEPDDAGFGFATGAAGADWAPAGASRPPNRHTRRDSRRIRPVFLSLCTQLRPSSCQEAHYEHLGGSTFNHRPGGGPGDGAGVPAGWPGPFRRPGLAPGPAPGVMMRRVLATNVSACRAPWALIVSPTFTSARVTSSLCL